MRTFAQKNPNLKQHIRLDWRRMVVLFLLVLPITGFTQIKYNSLSQYLLVLDKIDSTKNIAPNEALERLSHNEPKSSGYNVPEARIKYLYTKASVWIELDKWSEAKQVLVLAENELQEYPFPYLQCKVLRKKGVIQYEKGQYEKAQKLYMEAIGIAEENGLEKDLYLLSNNIGIIFLEQKYYQKAEDFLKGSLKKVKDPHFKAILTNNLALVYYRQLQLKESRALYEKALSIALKYNNKRAAITSWEGLANIYLEEGNTDSALFYTLHIKEHQEKENLQRDLLVTVNRLGLINMEKKDYPQAILYYQETLALAKALDSRHIPFIHANIAEAFQLNGDFEQALEHTVTFYELKDSIYSQEKEHKIEALLALYESEKKEKEIEILKRNERINAIALLNQHAQFEKQMLEKELNSKQSEYQLSQRKKEIAILMKERQLDEALLAYQEQQLDRESLIRNIAIVISVLIILTVVVLFYVYQQKIKNKELLAIKTEEINKTKTLELIREYELKAARANIEGQEIEKRRIASELHDGIAGSLAAIKLQLQKVSEHSQIESKLVPVLENLNDAYEEVRQMSHHVSPPGILRSTYTNFLKKYIQEFKVASELDIAFYCHGASTLNELTDEYKVEIYRIIQELLTNIFKHADAKTVEIQLTKNNEGISLVVEDNGKGFNQNHAGIGLGLSSIKKRVLALSGQLNVDSAINRGTIIDVNLPLTN